MYYNPTTGKKTDIRTLKDRFNASIPYDTEVVSNEDQNETWYLLHDGTYPEVPEGKKVVDGPIELVDGKYVKTHVLEDMTEEELQQLADNKLNEAKMERESAVSAITVEVDGMVFDGDETAQDRMSRVASIAGADEQDTTLPWVLADNTVANVTVAQIKEALRKALYAQAELWVKPYMPDEETTTPVEDTPVEASGE